MSHPHVKQQKKEKKIIGWREIIRLPKLKIKTIKVKVDTGAATSALHAEDIEIHYQGNKQIVHFTVYPIQKNHKKKIRIKSELIDTRQIRSSNGHMSERPVIRTLVQIGDTEPYEIDITLVNRDIMGFRMLLGRRALKTRFLVNPNKSFIFSPEKK